MKYAFVIKINAEYCNVYLYNLVSSPWRKPQKIRVDMFPSPFICQMLSCSPPGSSLRSVVNVFHCILVKYKPLALLYCISCNHLRMLSLILR